MSSARREAAASPAAMVLRPRHVLVDEFQDISRTQAVLLERLVDGWRVGDGRTLFVVGDPMQSIYRFREGEVSLFLRAQEQGLGDVALEPLCLTVSFRTVAPLIDWVNERLGAAFPRTSDAGLGAVPFERCEAIRGEDGGVELHAFDGIGETAAGEWIAALVERTLAADPTGTVGILLRARAQARELLPALRARGIPHRAVEIGALRRRPVVGDLLALAFALRCPHDRLHWLALLRGPLCGLTLRDLQALAGDDTGGALVDAFRRHRLPGRLSADGRVRLARFAEVVRPAIERVAREPPVPWVEALWLQLGGPAACEGEGDEIAAERCLVHLAELERSGELRDRRALDDALAALHVSDAPTPDARVRVMTVHRSKGLEFDHVVVPALQRAGRADEKRLLEWHEDTDGDARGLLMAPIDPPGAKGADAGPLAALIRGRRARADAHERLRLLYIACTRARRRLHLCATLAPPDARGERRAPPASSLLAPLHRHFVDAAAEGKAASVSIMDADGRTCGHASPPVDGVSGTGSAPAFVRVSSDACLPAFDRFVWRASPLPPSAGAVSERDWSDPLARHVGTLVHRLLQRLGEMSADGRRPPLACERIRIARELRTLGVRADRVEEALERTVSRRRSSGSSPRSATRSTTLAGVGCSTGAMPRCVPSGR